MSYVYLAGTVFSLFGGLMSAKEGKQDWFFVNGICCALNACLFLAEMAS